MLFCLKSRHHPCTPAATASSNVVKKVEATMNAARKTATMGTYTSATPASDANGEDVSKASWPTRKPAAMAAALAAHANL